MRILVVSNLYPPYYVGGYELGCHDVVEALKSRGHEIRVLTSDYGLDGPQLDGEIHRWLALDMRRQQQAGENRFSSLKKELGNQRAFHRVCKAFRPEIVYIWNLAYVSTSLALAAESLRVPVFYFVSDKDWTQLGSTDYDPWYRILSRSFPNPKRSVRVGLDIFEWTLGCLGLVFSGTLTFPHVHFVSEFLKQDAIKAGKPVNHGEVIHWGIDLKRFRYQSRSTSKKRLLYVGQITPYKGVVTAIEMVELIVKNHGREAINLTLVGGSVIPNYLTEMQELVRSCGLEDNIRFTGLVSRDHLPDIYHQHDILIFPSLLDEALTITTLEAMASGLVVVATSTGGNPEALRDDVNALIFPKGDSRAAADHVLRLLDNEELFERLRENGRRSVVGNFSLDDMVDSIERSLLSAMDPHDGVNDRASENHPG